MVVDHTNQHSKNLISFNSIIPKDKTEIVFTLYPYPKFSFLTTNFKHVSCNLMVASIKWLKYLSTCFFCNRSFSWWLLVRFPEICTCRLHGWLIYPQLEIQTILFKKIHLFLILFDKKIFRRDSLASKFRFKKTCEAYYCT